MQKLSEKRRRIRRLRRIRDRVVRSADVLVDIGLWIAAYLILFMIVWFVCFRACL